MVLYGIIKKERETFPIFAGMPRGKASDYKMKKVGSKLIEFTYDVNPNNSEDKMLIKEEEISRKFY
jgi:hypothetical protein